MISRDGDRFQLSGRLTIDAVTALYNSGLPPDGESMLVVDLGKVEAVDSAAVSLLLSWLRRAQRDRVSLCFSNVPDNLMSLARMYGVAELIPLCQEVSKQS
ncbi:MAG: STAS domain-containing protein [Betaproteobacteria bacterium]|nr:STAS domain-containing protein [Betaproteobacteria bacterium]